MFTTQNLIDEYIENIEARVVHEKDLEASHLEWLFGPDGNSPRSVGISPAYSQSGGLPAMACALDTRVLVINFHRAIPYSDGATRSGTVPRNVERRKLLEDELLCHPLCTLYSFDLTKIALSLHLHLHLHLTDAIDIQSALHIPDRSVVSSVETVIADACKIWSENIDRTFENMIYRSSKHKDLTDLVQRAWLCSYIGRYDSEAIRDLFYKAPKVDTSTEKFSEDALNVLQKVAYDMLRKDNMKPLAVTHEIKTRWDPRKERMVAESQRYANRITQNSTRVNISLAHSNASYSLPGGASNVRGKTAGLNVRHNLEGKHITSITTTGRDAPTQAELDCDNAILSMLQGKLPLLDVDWMKAIWLPSEPVVWSFTPPPNAPAIEIITHPKAPLNTSQRSAISKMLSPSLDDNITLIQGPPGTGKTTTIATYVLSMIKARQRGIWLMAQSNVAVKNIAEKLAKLDFFDFKLLVSQNFHFEWHEHLYGRIKENIIVSDKFTKSGPIQRALQGTQVILCTLSMISNPKLQLAVTKVVPIVNVIIDEASQIEVGQYVPLFNTFGKSLRKICFVGDDKQLPPHGQDDLRNLQSIFELEHLRESLSFLDTQYRMPPQIGEFISQQVYDGLLLSDEGHVVPSSTIACRFIDVNGSERLDKDGKSSYNEEEVAAIVLLAKHLQDENVSYRIITPYDAQRSALEQALKEEDLNWEDKCFNVDSFQGNEDHVIIISVVRSKALGFLANMRRTNVMLTRCQRAMYIVSSRAFLEGKGADSLVGKMAAELGQRPGAWLTHEDLEDGEFE